MMNNAHNRLLRSFYTRDDVTDIARDLIGKKIVSFIGMQLTEGIISETEAYKGIEDKASHAFGNRRTKRTETMYMSGGIAYIYFCYGIHSLLNVVTNKEEIPHAVLIRAIYPVAGIDIMSERLGRKVTAKEGIGPGRVTRLLGLTYADDREDIAEGDKIWIESAGIIIPDDIIEVTPRIGVGYAEEDALLPYRFQVKPAEMENENSP
jgi:DNA-3-methyladenine glycosylase